MTATIHASSSRKIYLLSDFHLGAPNSEKSLVRERALISWLEQIEDSAHSIFLLGDVFDFWFEYKTVVPKGFVRILGKLAEFTDQGIPVYFFVGNHDLWMKDYFETELNIRVYHQAQDFTLGKRTFFIGHGDGLGPHDKGYKRMKKLFTHPWAKRLYRALHPDVGMRLGKYLSVKNKMISGKEDVIFLGDEKEWLAQYARRKLEQQHRDYFIFGHRHIPLEITLSATSHYINLGDWIEYNTYAVFDGDKLTLTTWDD